jgi:hypothetical protein
MCRLLCRNIAASAIALAVLIPAGCGDPSHATVSGKVTLDGKPLNSGYVSFIPEDTQAGQTSGGRIIDGEYTAEEVTAGPMRVNVLLGLATTADNMHQIRKDLMKEAHTRRGGKMQRPSPESAIKLRPGSPGTGEVYSIQTGSQTLDLELQSAK